MRGAYYNEFDPFAAAWLRELIKAGLIPDGEVDERSILDVRGDDLRGFAQCHFFAGIGGWAYALALAGWPEDREVWTGSCPCQPLSVAGQGRGHADERHIWPAFYALIAERRPATVFGEQVASKLGREWLAGVRTDLEHAGYACGAANLPACSVGAPHRRERLWWVAVGQSDCGGLRGRMVPAEAGLCQPSGLATRPSGQRTIAASGECSGVADAARGRDMRPDEQIGIFPELAERGAGYGDVADADGGNPGAERQRPGGQQRFQSHGRDDHGSARDAEQPKGGVADAESLGPGRRQDDEDRWRRQRAFADRGAGGMGDSNGARWPIGMGLRRDDGATQRQTAGQASQQASPWSDAVWLAGADGKARRVKSGVRLLVAGLPGRVGLLRGLGNSIVPQVGAAFVKAFIDARA